MVWARMFINGRTDLYISGMEHCWLSDTEMKSSELLQSFTLSKIRDKLAIVDDNSRSHHALQMYNFLSMKEFFEWIGQYIRKT